MHPQNTEWQHLFARHNAQLFVVGEKRQQSIIYRKDPDNHVSRRESKQQTCWQDLESVACLQSWATLSIEGGDAKYENKSVEAI